MRVSLEITATADDIARMPAPVAEAFMKGVGQVLAAQHHPEAVLGRRR